ncbi:hypothetical protein BST61_g7938 [Cercospora zeina]
MDSKVKDSRFKEEEQTAYKKRGKAQKKELEMKPPHAKRQEISDLLNHPDQSNLSAFDPEEHAALGERAKDNSSFVAQESRRERYMRLIHARWGKDWARHSRNIKLISKKYIKGPSVTVTKHLAIMAFWVPAIASATKMLRTSTQNRRRDPHQRNRAAHVTANDVKLALGTSEELQHKGWDELADQALRGVDE